MEAVEYHEKMREIRAHLATADVYFNRDIVNDPIVFQHLEKAQHLTTELKKEFSIQRTA